MFSKRKCQAEDETKCPYHGSRNRRLLNFDKGLKKHLLEKQAEAQVMSAGNTVTKAMESSLIWDGKKPKWWKKYENSVRTNKVYPSQAYLMDVIDSPMGKLAVVWENQSQSDINHGVTTYSGFGTHICGYKLLTTGEDVGYVKLTYMNDETFSHGFGDDEFTPFRWRDFGGNTIYGFRDDDEIGEMFEGGMTEEKKVLVRRKLWIAAKKSDSKGMIDSAGNHVEYYKINEEHLPDDETVKADLKVVADGHTVSIKEQRKYYATPYVDYSKVSEELKGKGFGAGMYVYAARKLGERGKMLRGSGIQTDHAKALWSKFNVNFPKNTSTVSLSIDDYTSVSPVLDFRKKK